MPESTPDPATEPRTFEASTADEALVLVTEELGTDAEILGIERVTKGGIAGFFAREVIAVTARRAAPRPTAKQRASVPADDVIDDRPAPAAAGGARTAGVDRVLEMLKGQVDAREETFAERLQARLDGSGRADVEPPRREPAIDLTAFDHPSEQLSPEERVAAVRRESQRTRETYATAAAPAAPARAVHDVDLPVVQRALPRPLDADAQAAREEALRALILAEAAAQGVVPTADPAPAPAPTPTPEPEVATVVDDDAPPTPAEVRAVEDRAAAAIAALRAERNAGADAAPRRRGPRTVEAEPEAPVDDMPEAGADRSPSPSFAAAPEAPVDDVARSPLWRRVSAAATDSHPGTGPVDWGVDALVHLGLPLAVVRATFEVDPRDDLAWIEAVAGAVATYCRPLPGGPSVLVGPRADRIGAAIGLDVTPFPEPPPYGGSVCLRTRDDGPGRAWLSKVRGDRWLHVVAGGEWEDLVAKEPLAVSWVGHEALVPALQLCAAKGLVLGYGASGVPGSPVTRAHPVEVALAVRSLVTRR